MDFGLLALIIVGTGKVLDYVAPRTKTKWDDRIRDGVSYVVGFIPLVNKMLGDKIKDAQKEPPMPMARTAPSDAPPGGPVVRDHRE